MGKKKFYGFILIALFFLNVFITFGFVQSTDQPTAIVFEHLDNSNFPIELKINNQGSADLTFVQTRDALVASMGRWNNVPTSKINFSNSFYELESLLGNIKNETLENRLIYLYLKQYLADDILVKADRASMYNSLEVRAPFLDYRLVDFINSLPFDLKLKGFTTKYILKELMQDKLPDNIINRPKKGFGVPVAKWLNNELKDFTNDLLAGSRLQNQGIFNSDYVSKILAEHRHKIADHRKKIWTLLMFQIWHDKWL